MKERDISAFAISDAFDVCSIPYGGGEPGLYVYLNRWGIRDETGDKQLLTLDAQNIEEFIRHVDELKFFLDQTKEKAKAIFAESLKP
tara:strand:- start:10907 stop:11167 length:261 start_codon:yes stop_codon:yes gene_type:complete